jgi:hypothetical protein
MKMGHTGEKVNERGNPALRWYHGLDPSFCCDYDKATPLSQPDRCPGIHVLVSGDRQSSSGIQEQSAFPPKFDRAQDVQGLASVPHVVFLRFRPALTRSTQTVYNERIVLPGYASVSDPPIRVGVGASPSARTARRT